jgi:Rrf2 family iron-sulfur cluster assembly transcriptional regulator
MPLSSRSKTAIAAMIDLTILEVHAPVSLVTLAERQCISTTRLEKIFFSLRQARLVTSVRGPGGGYSLSRNAKDICLVEIARIFEPCALSSEEHNTSVTHELWQNLRNQVLDHLDHVNLQSLAEKALTLNSAPNVLKPSKLSRGIAPILAVKQEHKHIPNSIFALGNLKNSL